MTMTGMQHESYDSRQTSHGNSTRPYTEVSATCH